MATWLSTFLLESINFLVLVWILSRFLYRPVLDVIAKRRAEIEKTVTEAKRTEEEAEALQKRYQGRLAEWQQEQKEAHEKLSQEIEDEKHRRMDELHDSLAAERDKMRAAEARRTADLMAQCEQKALQLGAQFASRLLQSAATRELQSKLVERVLKALDEMTPERMAEFLGSSDSAPESVSVASAFPLEEAETNSLREQLQALTSTDMPVKFKEDPDLMAGIQVSAGGCVLGLNLRDELADFARLGDDRK